MRSEKRLFAFVALMLVVQGVIAYKCAQIDNAANAVKKPVPACEVMK